MTGAPVHEPSLATVLERAIWNVLASVHTAFPARVEKYDHATAKADVKPLLARRYEDAVVEMPVVPNVPVIWPRSTLGGIGFPLQRGDGVLVVCSERSLDGWLSQGGIVAPQDLRKFDLSDAIAIPGLYPFTSETKAQNNEDFFINYKDRTITIKDNGDIELKNDNGIIVLKSNGQLDVNGGNLTVDI